VAGHQQHHQLYFVKNLGEPEFQLITALTLSQQNQILMDRLCAVLVELHHFVARRESLIHFQNVFVFLVLPAYFS